MSAFLTNPFPHPFHSRPSTSACPRRPLPTRHRAHIRVSSVTDELRSIDNPHSTNDLNPPIPATPPRPQPPRPQPSRPQPPSIDIPVTRPTPFNQRSRNQDRSSSHPPFVPDPSATYYTKCSNCQAAYEIDPSDLGRGRRVACAVCANEWYQRPDRLMVLKETEGAKAYPMEKKEHLMSQARAEKRDSPRNNRRDNRRSFRSRQRFSVFIGNLPFSVTESDLEQLIKAQVDVLRVSIVKDPSGRSRGFAFADVPSDEQVQLAVEKLNGVEIGGRAIAVRPGRKNA